MIGSYLWWSVQFGINLLDFVMLYLAAHWFLKRNIMLKTSHIIFCIFYTLSLAPVFYFNGGYVFRMLSLGLLLFVIKMVVNRQDIGDLVFIMALYLFILTIIQLPTVPVIWFISEKMTLAFPLEFLIGQILTFSLMLFVGKRFKLNQWFNTIQKNIILKMNLLILVLLFITIASVLNFNYEPVFLLIFTASIICVELALLPIMLKLYHNNIGIISVHDLKNSLLSTGIAITSYFFLQIGFLISFSSSQIPLTFFIHSTCKLPPH